MGMTTKMKVGSIDIILGQRQGFSNFTHQVHSQTDIPCDDHQLQVCVKTRDDE